MLINTEKKFFQAVSDLTHCLKIHPYLIVDVETTGLNMWHEDKMCGIALGHQDQCYYFPFRHMGEGTPGNLSINMLEHLREILAFKDLVHVGWNYKFDIQMLLQDGFAMPKIIEDVMLAAHLMNENEYVLDNLGVPKYMGKKPLVGYQLKRLADKYLGVNSSSEEQVLIDKIHSRGLANTPKKTKSAIWQLPAGDVAPYAESDVRLTQQMRDFYYPHLVTWRLDTIWQEVNKYNLIMTQAEIQGMKIDINLIQEYMQEAKENMFCIKQKICDYAGYPINVNSPIQISTLLGTPDSKAETLIKLKDNKIAEEIINYRKWSKINNTYYEAYLKHKDKNNVIHPIMHMTGTVSGRLSCSTPNLQAVPRRTEVYKVKDVFIALPDHYIVQADYNQAEMRLGVDYAKEEKMKKHILCGIDLHTETSQILGIPREAAKRINFGVLYGIGKVSLAQSLCISESLAASYLQKYHKLYPGFKRLYHQCEVMATQRGYIRMWTGRVRRYDKYNPSHKAMSNLIQGGVAEIMRIAIMKLAEQIPGLLMCLQVHDSIIFQIPKKNLDWIPKIKNIMETMPFGVPMTVSIEYGESWGKLIPWNPNENINC